MMSLKLFDRKLYKEYNIITSKNVQLRFMFAVKRRSSKLRISVKNIYGLFYIEKNKIYYF